MKNELHNSSFARMYLWVGKAKFTAGIFFMAFVIFYFFLGFIVTGEAVPLNTFTAIQMMIACFLIGLLQQVIMPIDKLDKTRSVLWVACGIMISIAISLLFNWFEGFPMWCALVFYICTAIGMAAMLLEAYFQLHRETKTLNENLKRYQSKGSLK